MSKRQSLGHRSALVDANRGIAYATAQLTAPESIIAEPDRTGLDAEDARDVLDTGAAHLTLLEQLSVVLRLLRMAQQQKGERPRPAKRV